MTIREFINEMDRRFPKALAAEWDCDGLQCCADPDRELSRVLVALDGTEKAIDKAVEGGYELLLTHHPMIFGKAGDIVPDKLYGNRIIKLITAGVAAASFHTRFDAGEGGVNDCLAEAVGIRNTTPFGDAEMPTGGRIGEIDSPMGAEAFAAVVKEKLGAPAVTLSGDGMIRRVAVLGGSGKDFVLPAKAAGADAIVIGESSYNASVDFAEMGMIVIEAGHYYTEFPSCYRLAKLAEEIAGAKADVYEEIPQRII